MRPIDVARFDELGLAVRKAGAEEALSDFTEAAAHYMFGGSLDEPLQMSDEFLEFFARLREAINDHLELEGDRQTIKVLAEAVVRRALDTSRL